MSKYRSLFVYKHNTSTRYRLRVVSYLFSIRKRIEQKNIADLTIRSCARTNILVDMGLNLLIFPPRKQAYIRLNYVYMNYQNR